MRDGETGVLFGQQTVDDVIHAMETLEEKRIGADRGGTQRAVQKFSEERFRRELAEYVTKTLQGSK